MEEWKAYKLSEVCSRLRSGKSISSSLVTSSGEYPVIGGNGVRGYAAHYNFEGECCVIGRQGAYCGNVRYFNGSAYMTEHAIVVVGNEKADTYYLTALLSTMNLGHLSAQSAQPGLSVQTLSKQEVTLPSITTQRKVSAILKSLDDKIELNNRINHNLEEQAQALYKSWFIDFEPFKDGKFVESEMGFIPIGFKISKVAELCESVSKKPTNDKGKMIFLNTGDIENGQFLHASFSDVSTLPGQAKKSIKKGDILYSEIRPANKHFAYVNIVADDYVVSTKLMVIRCHAINSRRLYQYLTLDKVIEDLQSESETRSGTFPQITFENIKNKILVIGTPEVERQYSSMLEMIYDTIDNNYRQIDSLCRYRDALLPKLMSGELTC